MALDLSALDRDTDSPAESVSDGRPLRAPLNMFYEDPHQPRKEIDPDADDRDRDDIKARGVLQAITVAPAGLDGRMRIIFGARRWRLSCEGKLADIPYVIQDDLQVFDNYAQVAENERRKNLSPLDLAMFIAKRKKLGDKNAYIAKQIGIGASEITAHLALVEAPDYIRALYTERKCRTPKYLYELMLLAREHPHEVALFCSTSTDFERKTITTFSDSIKRGNRDRVTIDAGNSSGASLTSGELCVDVPLLPHCQEPDEKSRAKNFIATPHEAVVSRTAIPIEREARKPFSDSSKLKRPSLIGKYQERAVTVMLYKRPTTPGAVFVTDHDDGSEFEVEFSSLKELALVESATG